MRQERQTHRLPQCKDAMSSPVQVSTFDSTGGHCMSRPVLATVTRSAVQSSVFQRPGRPVCNSCLIVEWLVATRHACSRHGAGRCTHERNERMVIRALRQHPDGIGQVNGLRAFASPMRPAALNARDTCVAMSLALTMFATPAFVSSKPAPASEATAASSAQVRRVTPPERPASSRKETIKARAARLHKLHLESCRRHQQTCAQPQPDSHAAVAPTVPR